MQDGWKGIEAVIRNGTAAEDKDEKPLPLLTEGMTFTSVSAEKSEHFTTPPKPYTVIMPRTVMLRKKDWEHLRQELLFWKRL